MIKAGQQHGEDAGQENAGPKTAPSVALTGGAHVAMANSRWRAVSCIDPRLVSGTTLLAIVNRRAVLGAGARPSRVTAWPFVKSARLLSAEGHPADAVIEMSRGRM
jgi:hypothetical protein